MVYLNKLMIRDDDMKCIYCGKKLEDSTEYAFKVDEVSPCCSQNCLNKSLKYLNRPLKFSYFRLLLVSIGLGILTAFVDTFLVEIPFKKDMPSIASGLFFILASYIFKPFFYTSIRVSIFLPRILGFVILIYTLVYIFLIQ